MRDRLMARPEAPASDALDRRLDPGSPAPIAVALSGGADSLLTLLIAKAWADRRGRAVAALTVDHRLQAASAGWTRHCAEVAAGLGVGFRDLAWDGPKPTTGLPAAARLARHRLLADAARELGARVILLGHTASDIDEGEAMRATGTNIGTLREWSPSPVWPQGRELFCLRPLLAMRREEVRARLAAEGWSWIDDPANDDQRYGRPRARTSLQQSDHPPRGGEPRVRGDERDAAVKFEADGSISLARQNARLHPLQIALLCVCGGETPARTAKVEALVRRIVTGTAFTATLGGCKVVAGEREIVIARDAGEARRGGLVPIELSEDRPVVWDGRFEIAAGRPGLSVRALAGLAARLPRPERARLCALPTAARGALPAIMVNGGETVTCPILAERPEVRARPLAPGRFLAATGQVADESAANRLAHGEFTFEALSWARGTEKGRTE